MTVGEQEEQKGGNRGQVCWMIQKVGSRNGGPVTLQLSPPKYDYIFGPQLTREKLPLGVTTTSRTQVRYWSLMVAQGYWQITFWGE